MKKIKALFYVLGKSLTSLSYYKDVVNTNFRFSVKYILGVIVLTSIITSGFLLGPVAVQIKNEAPRVFSQIKEIYPNDLVVKVSKGVISTNQPEPYIIAVPQNWLAKEQPEKGVPNIENIIVFDKNGTVDDLQKYKTLVLINNVNIITQEEGGIKVYPTKEMPDSELAKAKYEGFVAQFEKLVVAIPAVVLLVGTAFVALLNIIAGAVEIVMVGLVLLIIGKTMGSKLTLVQNFKIALHTYTLPLLIDTVVNITKIEVPFKFWFFVVNLIFGVIVLAKLKTMETSTSVKN